MLARLKKIAHCSYHALVDTIMHDGIEHAGYLAFLGLLSFFPFLVFLFALSGVIGEQEVGLQFVSIIVDYLPNHVVSALEPRINEITEGPPQGLMTLAIVGSIWTASSMVEGLRTILNRAYRVHTPPTYLFRRLLSIGQFLVITFFIILVMLFFVLWPLFVGYVGSMLTLNQQSLPLFSEEFWTYVSYGFTGIVLVLMVGAMYYVLPNIKQKILGVLPGAVLVAVLWLWGARLFTEYLQNFNQINTIYGSLQGVIASLLFFYIMSVILIYGAEFNYLLMRARGESIEEREEVDSSEINDSERVG